MIADGDLAVAVLGARAEPYAAVPTLVLRLGVDAGEGRAVHALVLRVQIRIEPQRRRYSVEEQADLRDLFGEPAQWATSLHPFLWTHVTVATAGFTGSTELDLPVPCTYDFEVSAARYLHGLAGGDIPLVLLFSGTLFGRDATTGRGLDVQPVGWHVETDFRLPSVMWRQLMDRYFPDSGWLRLRRDTIDALGRYKAAQALPSWELTVERLLEEAGA